MPRHWNGSCLHWSGLNSRPSRPSPPAICGMAAEDILKGLETALLLHLIFGEKVRAMRSCAAVRAYCSNEGTINRDKPGRVHEWLYCLSSKTTPDIHNCGWCWAYSTRAHQVDCMYVLKPEASAWCHPHLGCSSLLSIPPPLSSCISPAEAAALKMDDY